MTATYPDTKAYWRRRALRAEARLQSMDRIRQVDALAERAMVHRNAAMSVALAEIRDVLAELNAVIDEGGKTL